MYSSEFFSLQLIREKIENTLEISGNLVSQKCGHCDRVFALDVIGCHAGVQVIPIMTIYQEKILFTYFDLNSYTSVTNIELVKFQGNVHSPSLVVVKRCMLV